MILIFSSHSKDENDPCDTPRLIRQLRIKNINRYIRHLNINSLRNKFYQLKLLVLGNVDVLYFEIKIDSSFPTLNLK